MSKKVGEEMTDTERSLAISEFSAKFWAWVDVRGPSECWIWQVWLDNKGYPRKTIGEKTRIALGFPTVNVLGHRVAYRLYHGHIDHNLCVDHLCHDPRCCNPHHLRQCTQSENARRKWFHVFDVHPVTGESLDDLRLKRRPRKPRARNRRPRRPNPKMADLAALLSEGVTLSQAARDLNLPLGTAHGLKVRINKQKLGEN